MDGGKFVLTREKYRMLVRATIRKLRNAADLADDGAVIWGIIEVAIKDACGISQAAVSAQERDRNKREAHDWLWKNPKCREYCELIGLSHEWMIERVRRLEILEREIP